MKWMETAPARSGGADKSGAEDRILRNMLITYFMNGLTAVSGSLLPFLRKAHGLSYDFSGLLLSGKSVGGLVAMLLTGVLPLWLGRRRSILAMSALAVVSYAVIAGGIGVPGILLVACVMEGAAAGGIANFSNTVISTLPGEKATRGYNLLHGLFAVGAFLAPLILVLCTWLWPETGWRVMAGVACGLYVLQVAAYAVMELPAEEKPGKRHGADLGFLRDRQFWLGTLMIFFYLAAEYTIMGWLVTYFQDAGILSPDLAQVMNSLLWLLIFAGRMVGAAITGRVSRGTILLVDGVGMLCFFLLMLLGRSPALVVLGLVGVGAFMATLYPTAFAFGSDSIKGNDLGCGLMNFIGAVGGTIAPSLVGLVAERAGDIRAGMMVVAVSLVLMLGAILLSVGMGKNKKAA